MAASFMKARMVARHGKMTNCFSSDDATCPNGSHKYAYDGANRLTPINTTAAVYSYFGPQRIKKVLGSTTTRYIYLGSKPIAKDVNGAESNSSGTRTRTYGHLPFGDLVV